MGNPPSPAASVGAGGSSKDVDCSESSESRAAGRQLGVAYTLAAWIDVALRGISWAAMILFVWYCFASNIPTWAWERRGDDLPFWERFRSRSTVKYKMDAEGTADILDGWDVQAILFLWFPVLAAAVCSCVAETIENACGFRESYHKTAPTMLTSLQTKVMAFVSHPMPGQRFWLYWCDGLSLLEFAALLSWIVAHCVCFWDFLRYYETDGTANDKIGIRLPLPLSVRRLQWISLSLAWLALLDLALLFLPISHNCFLHYLTGLPYSALIRFHRWIGNSTLLLVCGHGTFFYFYWIACPEINFWHEFFDWGKHEHINILAGSLAGCCGLALWVTSINWVRRNYFEVFYKTHIIGFLGFIFFGMIHYNGIWPVLVPGLALYAADITLRLVQSQAVAVVAAAFVSADHKTALLEVPVAKELVKCPMQDLFLMIPSITRWQWHPFSVMASKISSDRQSAVVTIAMKAYGSWTQEAIKQITAGSLLPVRVTGALDGIPLASLSAYDSLVLVAGGVGVTPFFNLLDAMIEASKIKNARPVQRVQLLWSTRSSSEFSILPASILAAAREGSWLSLSLYCTGKQVLDVTDKGDQVKGMAAPLASTDSNTDSTMGAHSDQMYPSKPENGALTFASISAFFWDVARPASPKFWGPVLSPLYHAAVVILAFVGAFLGLVVARPASIEVNTDKTDYYYKYGIATAVAMAVQSIGLPMILVVLPTNLISYLRSASSMAISLPSGPAALDVAAVKGMHVGYPEAGHFVDIHAGRPNLKATLLAAIEDSSLTRIGVFCAGPRAMIHSTQLLVHEVNGGRNEGQPPLHFEKHAYQL